MEEAEEEEEERTTWCLMGREASPSLLVLMLPMS
jgi:hypothetical protein